MWILCSRLIAMISGDQRKGTRNPPSSRGRPWVWTCSWPASHTWVSFFTYLLAICCHDMLSTHIPGWMNGWVSVNSCNTAVGTPGCVWIWLPFQKWPKTSSNVTYNRISHNFLCFCCTVLIDIYARQKLWCMLGSGWKLFLAGYLFCPPLYRCWPFSHTISALYFDFIFTPDLFLQRLSCHFWYVLLFSLYPTSCQSVLLQGRVDQFRID